MKILFIRKEENVAGYLHSVLFKKLLMSSEIEVQEYVVPRKSIYSTIKMIFRIKKIVKLNQIQLIHCFDDFSGKLAVFSGNRSKIIVSLFESEISHFKTDKYIARVPILFRKLFIKFFFRVVLLDSEICRHYLLKKNNYLILSTSLIRNSFFPIEKDEKGVDEELLILFLINDILNFEMYEIVNSAVSKVEKFKVRLLTFNAACVNNDILNSASLVIGSFDARTVKENIDKILMTNQKIISIQNNELLESYSKFKNLHLCSLNAYYIYEKIEQLLVFPTHDSRSVLIQKRDQSILKILLATYKKNYTED